MDELEPRAGPSIADIAARISKPPIAGADTMGASLEALAAMKELALEGSPDASQ